MAGSSDQDANEASNAPRCALGRIAVLIATVLMFVGAFAQPAAAQICFNFCFTQSPTKPAASTGNAHLSASNAVNDLGSQFLQRYGAISSYRNAASGNNNPQGGGADTPAERYRRGLRVMGSQHAPARKTISPATSGEHGAASPESPPLSRPA